MTDRELLRHTVATLAYRADIAAGRVGPDQTPAQSRYEFD